MVMFVQAQGLGDIFNRLTFLTCKNFANQFWDVSSNTQGEDGSWALSHHQILKRCFRTYLKGRAGGLVWFVLLHIPT